MIDVPTRLMLKAILWWIESHPNSAFSRFMTRPRGPRRISMLSPAERLANGLTSLLASAVFVGLALLIAYLGHEKHLYAPDGNLPLFGMFAFTILAGMGLVIGLYLLVKVFW